VLRDLLNDRYHIFSAAIFIRVKETGYCNKTLNAQDRNEKEFAIAARSCELEPSGPNKPDEVKRD